jgi:hypothetical protein
MSSALPLRACRRRARVPRIRDARTFPLRRTLVLLLVVVAFAGMAPAGAVGRASFFTRCGRTEIRSIDPIMDPGMFPSMHKHQFFGVAPTRKTRSGDLLSLRTKCSSSADHSAYWAPVLRNRAGATVAAPNINAYYVRGNFKPGMFPAGTKLVGSRALFTCGTGRFVNLSAGQQPFPCRPGSKPSGGNSDVFPKIIVHFPTCRHRDGKIGYGGKCVMRTPELQLTLRYTNRTSLGGLHPSSGSWKTMHADFMFGWRHDPFASHLKHCLLGGRVCKKMLTG